MVFRETRVLFYCQINFILEIDTINSWLCFSFKLSIYSFQFIHRDFHMHFVADIFIDSSPWRSLKPLYCKPDLCNNLTKEFVLLQSVMDVYLLARQKAQWR